MEKIHIKPGIKDVGLRLDMFLNAYFKGLYSRTYMQKIISLGGVLVNSAAAKSNYKIREHDEIDVLPVPAQECASKPENIKLDILYEDKDLLVVNKPAGMVVHPGAGVKYGTLVNALLYYCKGLLSIAAGESRPGIVHRLDKDTSGIMLVAKNNYTHRRLAKQFKQREVQRRYVARVTGVVEFDGDQINLPLGRHVKNREKMMVRFSDAKEAITKYKVLKRFSDSTLLEIWPVTGRTHQIRVHMKAIGHPIIGDTKYGDSKSPAARQMLHADWIRFFHPGLKKYVEFSSPAPF